MRRQPRVRAARTSQRGGGLKTTKASLHAERADLAKFMGLDIQAGGRTPKLRARSPGRCASCGASGS
eukprot:3633894-Alexandrium_andersonii.AAC.1